MFYYLTCGISAFLLLVYILFRFAIFKKSERFGEVIYKMLKVFSVVYFVIAFLCVFLPDAFVLCLNAAQIAADKNISFAIIRWFGTLSFIIIPISVFYKNRTIRNISTLFCLAMGVVSIFYYSTFIGYATSSLGKGLNSISVLSNSVKSFLIDTTFRSVILGVLFGLNILIPVILAINERHFIDLKSIKEIGVFFLVLILSLISCIPIYVPQYLFGLTDVILSAWSWPHIVWLVVTIAETIILFFIFRNRSDEEKQILCFIMAFCLLFQYNQMFGASTITLKRLPLQLCNIGAYLIVLSLLTKNSHIFNFTLIVNVTGVAFAMLSPDFDGEGLFYLYNMHFILEHTNVLIVPILALSLKVFPKMKAKAIWDYLIGFLIYFIIVLGLGTWFNAIEKVTGDSFYHANYLYMFDKEVAADLLGNLAKVFDKTWVLGNATFSPLAQGLIFGIFNVACILIYLLILLFEKIFYKEEESAIHIILSRRAKRRKR